MLRFATATGQLAAGSTPLHIPTGQFFWAKLLACFPCLQLIDLLRLSWNPKQQDNQPVLRQSPGEGHDIVLNTFDWREDMRSSCHRASLEEENATLLVVKLGCACGSTDCVEGERYCRCSIGVLLLADVVLVACDRSGWICSIAFACLYLFAC